MHLLVAIINEEGKVEEVLGEFLRLGVTGATVLKSEGMGKVLSQDVPVFGGLQALMSRSRPQNTTVFSVIESPTTLRAAIDAVTRVVGNIDAPSTGIVFTVAVSEAWGLASELEDGGAPVG